MNMMAFSYADDCQFADFLLDVFETQYVRFFSRILRPEKLSRRSITPSSMQSKPYTIQGGSHRRSVWGKSYLQRLNGSERMPRTRMDSAR